MAKKGSGETGRTTAHLCNALDDRYMILKNISELKKQNWPPKVIPSQ
jgi:hypothetical protein